MTLKTVKRDALIKWEYAAKTGCGGGELINWLCENHIDVYNYSAECSFCQYYGENCYECSLGVVIGICAGITKNVFIKWRSERNEENRKKYASLIVDGIKAVKKL